jgi:hypothetical protein
MITQIQCPECGVCADAACDCGVAYVTAGTRAAAAVSKEPEKSDRAIASEIGVDHKTVGSARRSGGDHSPPEKRIGKDGKSYPAKSQTVRERRHDVDAPLETNDNSESDNDADNEMAPPEEIESHLLHTLGAFNENARMFNKLLKASAMDHEAVDRINTAIDRMIQKWRSIQSTLEKKEYLPH